MKKADIMARVAGRAGLSKSASARIVDSAAARRVIFNRRREEEQDREPPMGRSAARVKRRLEKKARRGFRGYPLATLAFYGPDDRCAPKAVASIMEGEDDDPARMRKWYGEQADVRHDVVIMEEVIAFIEESGALSVAMPDRIIGCPHEEGIDYEGPVCPECPFWANLRCGWATVGPST